MNITSSAFENNQPIPQKYSCNGENVSPPLSIREIPEGTRSLAILVDDPDAPAKVWVHWLIWNINPKSSVILEGNVPEGTVKGSNDFNNTGWEGPCPPSGTHRYFFRVYALDKTIDLSEGARRSDMEKAIEGHVIDSAELVGLYSK